MPLYTRPPVKRPLRMYHPKGVIIGHKTDAGAVFISGHTTHSDERKVAFGEEHDTKPIADSDKAEITKALENAYIHHTKLEWSNSPQKFRLPPVQGV